MSNADEYARAILAAKADPGNISKKNHELLLAIKDEASSRGNSAREALGIPDPGDTWGILR